MNESSLQKYGKEYNEGSLGALYYGSGYTTINKGQDTTLYSPDAYDYNGSSSYGASWGAVASDIAQYADVSQTAGAYGNAQSWAWTGNKILFQGSYSGETKSVFIYFRGRATGSILGGVGGSANGKIRMSIYDLTAGGELAGTVIWEDSSSNNFQKSYNNSYYGIISTTLTSGHYYLLREGVSGDVNQYGGNISMTDFWNNGPGAEGLDYTSIRVDAR